MTRAVHQYRRYGTRVLVVALAALVGPLLAGAADAPTLEVTRVDGTTASGQLVHLTPEVVLRGANGPFAINWVDVLSLQPIREQSAAEDDEQRTGTLWFALADGSELHGDIVADSDGGCVLEFRGHRVGPIALSAFRAVEVLAASPAGRREIRQQRQAFNERRVAGQTAALSDVAVVARDERIAAVSGRILALSPDGVRFEWNGRELTLRWDRVVGLIFAEPAASEPDCTVRIGHDETLAGRITGGDVDRIELRSATLGDMTLPWNDVARIDCQSERLVFLSGLTPTNYNFEPFFQKQWEYATDRTLSDLPLSVGGRRFARGICMHSKSALTYRVGGRFTRFAAFVGIVDNVGPRGCVAMRVVGDGRVLWEASEIRGGQPAQPVSVDIAGVQELTLVVDFGQELDIADHAAWGLARLIE